MEKEFIFNEHKVCVNPDIFYDYSVKYDHSKISIAKTADGWWCFGIEFPNGMYGPIDMPQHNFPTKEDCENAALSELMKLLNSELEWFKKCQGVTSTEGEGYGASVKLYESHIRHLSDFIIDHNQLTLF